MTVLQNINQSYQSKLNFFIIHSKVVTYRPLHTNKHFPGFQRLGKRCKGNNRGRFKCKVNNQSGFMGDRNGVEISPFK